MKTKADFKPPTKEEVEKLLDAILVGDQTKARLKPFDAGYTSALEWILGRAECLYERD